MPHKASPESVDIVIVTWNSLPYLEFCLDSIARYTNHPHRITIVDNGSDDGTGDFLSSISDISVVSNRENLGYPHAVQQGYDRTSSSLVCLMNDDIVVSPEWLSCLKTVTDTNDDLGILGPVRPGAHFIHPYTRSLSKSYLEESKAKYNSPQDRLVHFTQGKPYDVFAEDYRAANGPNLTTYDSIPHIISTCCALVRRSAVERVGELIDGQFEKYGADDTDLCWRLIKGGYKLGITSDVYIHHFEHVSTDRNNLDRYDYLKQNTAKLHQKWKPEINEYLARQLSLGKSRNDIMNESWLLKRLYEAVGENFWSV